MSAAVRPSTSLCVYVDLSPDVCLGEGAREREGNRKERGVSKAVICLLGRPAIT